MSEQLQLQALQQSGIEAGCTGLLVSGLSRALADRGDLAPETCRLFLSREIHGTGARIWTGEFRSNTSTRGSSSDQGKSVTHVHGWTRETSQSISKATSSTPTVLSPLGGLSFSPIEHRGWFAKMRKRWQDRTARRATVIAAYNESEARHLREINVHPRVEVLPLGIDTKEYAEVVTLRQSLSPKRGERTVLYLGPIHPREGLVAFLKAFAELGADADGWNVVLAGRATPQWRGKIEAAIQRKGGADRITFSDAPDFAAQLSLLAPADILVSPALQHRCPTSIMQAMACGVPVVATEPVAPDGVGDALVVCRPSRDELRDSLRSVMTMTEADRRALGERGLAWIKAHGDWSVITDRYLALYQSLV